MALKDKQAKTWEKDVQAKSTTLYKQFNDKWKKISYTYCIIVFIITGVLQY
jgi:hypothetical protein